MEKDIEFFDIIFKRFSKIDIDILRLLADGFTNEEISNHLHLSKRGVEQHMTELMAICGAKNRTHLAVLYVKYLINKNKINAEDRNTT